MVQCLSFSSPPTELAFIPTGSAGIADTLNRMVKLVREYRRNPTVRQLAVEIRQAARVPSKDWLGEVRALHRFVRSYITYVRDVRDVETLQTPLHTLQNRAGDCDDQSLLLASLLEAIGHPTKFVAMGFSTPEQFSHVLTETLIGTRWIPAETTLDRPVGWSPPGQRARMERFV
jgi:transglutaminase-like putative cysteine protease